MQNQLQEWTLDDYLRIFRLHRKLVFSVTFVVTLLSTLHMARQPDIYRSTVRILIEPDTARVVRFQGDIGTASAVDRSFLQTEYQVISSRAVMARVIEELNLASFPPYSRAKDPVGTLRGIVSVTPLRGTKLVDISTVGTKPKLVARITNAVAEMYAKINLERKRQMTTGGIDWLKQEVDKMEKKMREAQINLQDFREQHSSVDLDEQGQNTVMQRLQALNASLTKTREKRIEAEAKYREKHPELVELFTKEKELQLALFDQEQRALELSRLSIQFNTLLREAKTSESIYNVLLTRLKELSVQEGVQNNNVQVVDYAQVSDQPVGPMRKRTILTAAILGFLLGFGIALVLELMTSTVRTRSAFEALLEIPFLGHVPQAGSKKTLLRHRRPLIMRDSQSPMAENIRSIRTTLEFILPSSPSHVLLMTSALPSEGKSTFTANLAMALQEIGRKVLVIDADLRRPTFHHSFQIPIEPGLSNALQDQAQPAEIVHPVPGSDGLFVVPSGFSSSQPTDLLQSGRFKQMLDEWRKEYQYILIDSPPVLVAADACVLATMADGVVYIVRANQTHSDAVVTGKQKLVDVGAKIIGGILNGAQLELERGYRYYYSYGENRKQPAEKKHRKKERKPAALITPDNNPAEETPPAQEP